MNEVYHDDTCSITLEDDVVKRAFTKLLPSNFTAVIQSLLVAMATVASDSHGIFSLRAGAAL